MTVAELIEELKKYNPDFEVMVSPLNDEDEIFDIWSDGKKLYLGELPD